ncbi:MAG TPA: N-acyl homoserine lactonase family protein [Candidatus Dormibacteraeota bacterium]|jgi:N-acyl homoserine lactone hydrolase|nr:N-acyl homoserine lactonase family protein [Candidatus Dormibacteraeota bacterium]
METEIVGGPRRLYLFQVGAGELPREDAEPLQMSVGCYLVQTDDHNVLIDSGTPGDVEMPGPFATEDSGDVIEHLASIGLQPDDIDIVVSSHLDVDHIGHHDDFPAAEHVIQRSQYERARAGHPRFERGRSHWDHPSLRYRQVEGDSELLPGLELIQTDGHTVGHQSVLVRLPNTGPVLLAIDAVAMGSQFTPDRTQSPVDEDLETAIASTRRLLGLVEREQVGLTVFHHDGAQWATLRLAPEYYD